MPRRKDKPEAQQPAPEPELPSVLQRKFLAAYAQCGNITRAAELAEVHRSNHYRWLEDPDYESDFAAAHEQAIDLLEAEARRRAIDGVDEPVVYQGNFTYPQRRNPDTGEWERDPEAPPLAVRKFSDTLLIFLLKGAKPDKYRDNWKGEIQLPAGLGSRKIDLSKLTDEQLEELERILAQVAGSGRDRSGEGSEGEE